MSARASQHSISIFNTPSHEHVIFCVEGGEHAGLSIRWHLLEDIKPGLTKKPYRQVTAFGYAFVLCSDRRLPDPFLQPLDGFVMMLLDLRQDRLELLVVCICPARESNGTGAGNCGVKKKIVGPCSEIAIQIAAYVPHRSKRLRLTTEWKQVITKSSSLSFS